MEKELCFQKLQGFWAFFEGNLTCGSFSKLRGQIYIFFAYKAAKVRVAVVTSGSYGLQSAVCIPYAEFKRVGRE